jgi:hypothetical protein
MSHFVVLPCLLLLLLLLLLLSLHLSHQVPCFRQASGLPAQGSRKVMRRMLCAGIDTRIFL